MERWNFRVDGRVRHVRETFTRREIYNFHSSALTLLIFWLESGKERWKSKNLRMRYGLLADLITLARREPWAPV
jgi:hypothetical protein